DLDEAQHPIVPADQVNLTAVVGNAEVVGYDLVAKGPQMKVRFNLTLLASQQVLWFTRREMPAGKIQTADNKFGKPEHGASGRCARDPTLIPSLPRWM